jgi:MerR family transcriptional regulator, copper efflux regulator
VAAVRYLGVDLAWLTCSAPGGRSLVSASQNGTVRTEDSAAPSGRQSAVMTIGGLSRRTGVPVKTLRQYEDLGLIYTVGRSAGNYRLFDEEALWCVGVIGTLRGLGLTLAEISDLAAGYLGNPGQPVGPRLAELLRAAHARTEERIAELRELLRRIDEYRSQYARQFAGHGDFRDLDPHFAPAALDSPPGGRP